MCHPPALAGYCGGARHCAGHMVTAQSELPAASERKRAAIACAHSPRDHKWSAWQCHFGNRRLRHRTSQEGIVELEKYIVSTLQYIVSILQYIYSFA